MSVLQLAERLFIFAGEKVMGVEVYVGQLCGTVTENEVKNLFSVVGTVESVHLVMDSETGKFRGCGYVRMSTEEEAREAIDFLDGSMLGERLIVVRKVTKKFGKQAAPSVVGHAGKAKNSNRKD